MKFALLVLYAAGTLAAPVIDERHPKANIKVTECSGSRFSPGTTFEYEYEGDTIQKVEGTTQRSTGLQMSTKVLVSHLKECTFHMRLTDVELRTKSMDQDKFTINAESNAYKDALQANDLAFTMKGNTISSVRAHPSETTEMLNIKRGILSTLQLDESVKTETDVHGTCETKVTNEDGLIIKTKKLSECSDRTQEEIGIQSSSIKTSSNMKPLESKSMCTYAVDGQVIRKVVCDESHLFRPFSGSYEQKNSGAMTLVRQSLKLLGKKPTANFNFKLESNTVKTTVLFDHTSQESKADSLPEAVEVVIQRMVDASHLSVKETSANEFTSLVRMFRKLDQQRMTSIWNKYFDCTVSKVCSADDSNMKDLYRQYLLDAIAYCGTPTCVSVVKDVTIKGEINGERANMFLQSIALLAKTTNAMIRDILEIAQKKPSRQVYLTLGTLISRHCSKSPEECASNSGSAIAQAENFLLTTLKDCSGQENHDRVEEILLVLKAIGNAKRPLNAGNALITCAKNSKHANITMSVFEAIKGMPCSESTMGELREFVANENIAADKRIYAFKTSMKCADKKSLELLVHQYNIEGNKQVSSFMWSFFTNILESSNPDEKQAKTWLLEIIKDTPLKKTDLPMYQFSKHFEKSLYIDSLETGATATADVVFRPDGFLPSTAMFDVSAKVMGVPVDVIQTAVGIDGVETILENVFGPDGAMPKDFGLKLFNWTITAEKLKEMAMAAKGEGKTRQRRAARRDDMPLVNDIHEAINMKPPQPSGFMTLKVMGQEVRIMSYDDIYAMIDQIDNMNVIQLLLNIAKGGKKTFSKSVMFLEMTHTVPTGLGLPLKLKLAGSSVGTVELNGKFDIRNMFWGPGALSINGFVKPSAVVEISGSMSTESNYVSTGLRVVSNMMVSNMLKGSIDYKQNALLKINLDTPTEPLQVFKIASTPFMFLNEKFLTIEAKAGNSIHKKACLKSQLVGLGMCACARIPLAFRDYTAPYFPLTGPTHLGITLVRGDEKLTTIQFKTTMKKQTNGLEGLIEFSTPGAVYERKLSANMIYTDANNDKVFTVSTNEFGKTGSLKVSYNTLTSRTAIETKNNFLTPKEVTTRVVFFNQTGIAAQQFGVQMDVGYDWYKFKHVTKFVNRGTSYMLEAHTEYAPKKSITSAIEINTVEKKARAIFDINQIRQAFEIVGKLENTENENGVTLMFVHVPTNKKATLYTGYKVGKNKKEIMTSANIFGKSMKNILGWYQNGEIQSIEDFLLVDGQTAKFGTSWENRKDETAVQFSADVFGKKAISTVIYNSREGVNTIDLSSRVLDNKEVSGTIVLTNRPEDKTFSIRLNTVERPTEASIGLTMKDNKFTLMASGKGFDQRVKVFWTLDNTGARPISSLGFGYNKYSGGFRMAYYPAEKPVDRKACASIYYKTEAVEKTAATGCVEYMYTNQENMSQLALKYSVDVPEMKKKLGLEHVISLEQGRLNSKANLKMNDKSLASEDLELVYRGLTDMSLGYGLEVMSNRASGKVFSQKDTVGMEAKFNENSVMISNKFETGKIVSSISANGKVLPVTTEVTYAMGDSSVTPGFKINIGKYGLMTKCNVLYGNGKYGAECRNGIMEENLVLFGLIGRQVISRAVSSYGLEHKLGFTFMGKDYVYGYSLAYAGKSSDVKRVHELTAKLHYSATRASTVIFMLADGQKTTSLSVDVEYIPEKRVTHYISYNKMNKQIEASIEFLPSMFAKMSATLDDKIGYLLTTRASLQWEGFNKALTMINSYVNDDKEFMVSTSFASDISIGLRYAKLSQSLTIFAKALGKDIQLTGTYKNKGIEVTLTANGKSLFSFRITYDKLTKTFRMLAAQQERVLFDVSSGYNKFMKAFKLAFSGMSKWGGLYIAEKGQRTIVTVNLLGKGLAKIIINKKDMSMAVQSLRFGRASAVFKYVPKSKTLTVSAKTMKNRLTINLRTDWTNKIFSLHTFLNKDKAGFKVFFLKKAMIAKLIAGPKYTFKTVISKSQDNIKIQVQRIAKGKIVNQAVFKYGLNTRLSEIMFKWNAKMVSQLQEMMTPLADKAMNDVKEFVMRIASKEGKLVEMSQEVKAKIMELLATLDRAIAELDLEPVRKYVKTSAVKTVKEISDIVLKVLKSLASGLDEIKANTPMAVEKIRTTIKTLKTSYDKLTENLELKADVIVAKVKLLIQMLEKMINEGKVMIAKGEKEGRAFINNAMKESTVLLEKVQREIAPAMESISKVLSDVGVANGKVVEKFVELVKDFKIQGMRLEDITAKYSAEGEKLIKLYIQQIKEFIAALKKEATKQYELQSAKVLAMVQNFETIVKTTKVPYMDKTIAEVSEMVAQEIERLVKLVKSMDAEKMISETKETITKLVKAKSEDLEKVIKEITDKYVILKTKLPELTREVINKIVIIVKKYANEISVLVKNVEIPKPVKDYILLVKSTLTKHFGPLMKNVDLSQIDLSSAVDIIKAYVDQLLDGFNSLKKDLTPLYIDAVKQVRKIKIMGFRAGPLFDMQVNALSSQLETLIPKVMTMRAKLAGINSMEEVVKMINVIVEQVVKVFESRDTIMKKTMSEVERVYGKLQAQYKKATSKSFDEVSEQILKASSEGVMLTTGEMSSLIKQLVAMDLSEATWKAVNDANLLGRLEKLGVNEKIENALKYAKKVNVTQFVLTTLETIQELINVGVKRSAVMAMQTYAKIDKVVVYLRSIPKKDYETWLEEVAQFTVSTKDLVQRNLDVVIESSQKQAMKAYQTLEVLKTIDVSKYNEVVMARYTTIKDALTLVITKSQLVYKDLEQPTIELVMKYGSVVADAAKEQYVAITVKLVEGYGQIVTEVKAFLKKLGIETEVIINNLKTQIDELVKLIEKTYTDLLAKYGDMTWEQIGMKVEETAAKEFEALKGKILKAYEIAQQKLVVIKAMAMDMYVKAVAQVEQAIAVLDKRYTELKTKVTQITMEYYAKYEKTLKKIETVAMKIYEDVSVKGTALYNKIKDKTLKQIVDEIKAFINAAIATQSEILKAVAEQNMAKAKELMKELQRRMDIVVNNAKAIVPELKAMLAASPELQQIVAVIKSEGESIINQTLRNTVVLTKEVISAYTPVAKDIKKFAGETFEVIRVKAPAVIDELEKFVQLTVPKMVEYYKACAAKCEKRLNEIISLLKELVKSGMVKANKMSMELMEKTQALVAEIKNNETYKKYAALVEKRLMELKDMIEKLVKELKTNPKVTEAQKQVLEAIEKLEKTLKLAPRFMEIKKIAEKVIAEVKKFVEKNVEEQQQFVDQKISEVQYLVQVQINELRQKITEFTVKYDPTIQKLISLIKQIKVSAKFTSDKLEKLVMPSARDAMKATTAIVMTIPNIAKEATTYFAEAPEEAFWSAVAIIKEALAGGYGQMIAVDVASVELMVVKAYTNAVAMAKDLYIKSTDEWTKETINKIKEFIITVVEKAIVEFNTLKTKVMNVPAILKKYLETIPEIVEKELRNIYALISKNAASLTAVLEKSVALIKTYAEEIMTQLKTMWDSSAIKKIIDNKIWMEIISEIKNHELVVAVVKAANVVSKEVAAMQKEVMGIISKLLKISEEVMKKEFAALKVKALQMYTELEAKATELYNLGINEYKTIVEEAVRIAGSVRDIYDQKTIAQIVSMTIELYENAVEKATKVTQRFVAFAKLSLKDMMKIVETRSTELYTEMKAVLTSYYGELERLYSEFQAQYKELSALVMTKLEQIRAEFMAKYGKQMDEVIVKAKSFVAEAMAACKTYSKLAIKELDNLSALVKKAMTWLETAMTSMKKMTIKQSIETLKKLPTDIKVFTTLKINELVKILTDLKTKMMAEIDVIVAQGKEMYEKYAKELKAKVEQINKLIATLKLKGDKVMRLVELYMADMTKVVYNIQKEVADTVVFVYNYYNIGEKYNKIKKFIINEIMKIINTAEKTFPEIAEKLNAYLANYKAELMKFADEYESLLSTYARDAEDFTKTTMMSTSDILLRSVHKALVYVDNFDTEMIMSKLRSVVNYIKKHISVIQKEGLVIARFVHPDINSILSYYTNSAKATVMETVAELKSRGMAMLRKIETDLPALQKQIMELKEKIQNAVMKSTFELRRDMNVSAKVLRNIALRLISMSKSKYASTFAKINLFAEKVMTISETYKLILQESYKKIEPVVNDIFDSATPEIMYAKIEKYLTEGIEIIKTKYGPMVEPMLAELKTKAIAYAEQLKKDLPVYYEMGLEYLKKQEITIEKVQQTVVLARGYIMEKSEQAVEVIKIISEELKKGVDLVPLAAKFEAWYEKWMNFVVAYIKATWVGFCNENADLCKLIDEGVVIHKMLFQKYKEIVMSYLSVGKAHVDRAVRKITTSVNNKNLGEDSYLATAMIMGNRILTFDNKLYDFVEFKKTKKGPSPCSYLLARDFQDKKFTISKLDNALIVSTKEMTVKIRKDGNTKTTINNKNSFSLPVQSGDSKCVRVDNLILCHFEKEGLKVTVDLKNDFTTISISGWHKGKSQGLLGTYNNEAHDEWRLPNNEITSNINEFANAYELSGAPECQLDLKTDNTKVCDGKISKMCQAYFSGKDSPFEPYFSAADPTPFMDACARETKCTKKFPKKAHCSIVAGYVALLRTKGVWVPQVSECMAEKGRPVNSEWVQKAGKAIDVVVMISQNKNMQPLKKNIAQTMFQVHKLMKNNKFNIRYALVGFGGEGVHEAAHSHPLRRGPSVFGYIMDLKKEIKSMPFKGTTKNTNDGYHAILTASNLKFRPNAEKIFILFNSEPHNSHSSGPSFDETKYVLAQEANAPLFVFDSLTFANVGKEVKVIGETARKIYTTDNLEGTTKNLEMPSSEFKELVKISKGGLFSNTLTQPKHVAVSLNDAVMTWVKADMELCKKCILRASWTGQSKPICVSDKRATC